MSIIISNIWFGVIALWLLGGGAVGTNTTVHEHSFETKKPSSSSSLQHRRQQQRPRTVIDPPNAEQVGYGYNVLLGLTPAEQRQALMGSQLFVLTGSQRKNVNGYIQYDQFSDMSATLTCTTSDISNNVWWATSTASLESQVSKSSYGLNQSTDLGVQAALPPAVAATAETTMQTALVFGNSKSSITSFEEKNSGRTYSFDARAKRSLYNVQVDYNSIDTWTREFRQACRNLGLGPLSTKAALQFFQQYGTHGLEKASFGQECTSSLYMESGETLSTYYNFRSEESTSDLSLLWWTASNSQYMSSEIFTSESYGFQYSIANRGCYGELDLDSTCGELMRGTGKDAPAIIDWTYKPIWEMNVPRLSNNTKSALHDVFVAVLEESVACMGRACSGQGACASKMEAWNAIERISSSNLGELFDEDRCYCFDDYQGSACSIGRPLKVSLPVVPRRWENTWKGRVDFSNGDPLCGLLSQHHQQHKDRRFKFPTCQINEPGTDFVLTAGEQETFESWGTDPFTLLCDADKVMTRLESRHDDLRQDRRWAATCTHFKNTRTNNQTCEGFDIDDPRRGEFENTLEQRIEFKCPIGKLLKGMYALYDIVTLDRQFKFRCCELMVEHDTVVGLTKSTNWTMFVNEFQGPMDAVPALDDEDAAFCGVSSNHSVLYKDRRFRFKYCKPSVGPASKGSLTKASSSGYNYNSLIDCTLDSVLVEIKSSFHDRFMDRLWDYKCHRFVDWKTDDCQWTDWVNWFDQPFDFECGDQHVIAGMESKHDNILQDRRFKFKCCRWKSIET